MARLPPRAVIACAALGLVAACSDAPAATPAVTVHRSQEALSGQALAGRLGCVACHADMPRDPTFSAPPLRPGALDADSVLARLYGRADHVPDFHLDEAEALALALFLGTGDRDAAVRRAIRRNREVDATAGRRVYVALNCAGCHPTRGIAGRATAPPLGLEGVRVRADWLRRFLLRPSAIRPFGAIPGTGSRMPRFALSGSEADSLVAFLMRPDRAKPALPDFEPARLSAFDTLKARRLLETRFSCLGCHALGGEGGRVGPDLSRAGTRLEPAFIRAMIEAPQRISTDGMMPPTEATPATLDFLASYLSVLLEPADRTEAPDSARDGYLSLIENKPIGWEQARDSTYLRVCAACHGRSGGGDGWNARFLRARPATHSDSAAMSIRSDDVLFDAIAAGARFLDRSPEMPGFGGRLPADSVRSLVEHIRTLCRCSGPAWSRDGS